jgi:hypothetical protein
MYVKLNYTSDVDWRVGFRILNQIIADPTIVSTSTLQTVLTTSSAHSSLTTGLDYVNSEVRKITTLTSCISHYSSPTSGALSGEFTIRQTVYDTTGTYFYYQLYDIAAAGAGLLYTNLFQRVGSALTSGNMTTGQAPLTAATQSTAAGTAVQLNTGAAGYYQYAARPLASAAIGMTNIRCFWFYVTDTCFLWTVTTTASSPLGFGATYNAGANYPGPWYFGQYTRYDYFNTSGNGVIPYLMSNDRSSETVGFGISTDWDTAHNVTYNQHGATSSPPFSVFNLVNALPKVGTSWPLIYNQQVNWGPGPRYDERFGLTASGTNNATRSTVPGNPVLFTTVSTRFPSADLSSTGYAMLPILWRCSFYGNTGGNSSAQTGVYLFNGDYFPGDEFTNGGITYKIWPVYAGYSTRIGLAVPKQ